MYHKFFFIIVDYLFFTYFFVFASVESILPKKSSIDFLFSSSGLKYSFGLVRSFFGEFEPDKRDDADDDEDADESRALVGSDSDFVN